MNYLVSIWCWVAGALYFGSLLVIGIGFTYVFPARTYDPWIKVMMRFLFKLIASPVRVEGETDLDPDGVYIFMSNHVSLFDLPMFAGFIPVFFRGVEASYQFNWPLYGFFVRRYGNLGIEREDIRSSIATMRQAEKLLREGTSLVVLPEGGRTEDGELLPFKKLPFNLAQRAGVPIVPIGLSGLYTLKRKGNWLIRPTPLKIKFGPMIPAETVTSLSNKELLELTRAQIKSLIEYE